MIQLPMVSPRASKKNATNQDHTLMSVILNIMHSNYATWTKLGPRWVRPWAVRSWTLPWANSTGLCPEWIGMGLCPEWTEVFLQTNPLYREGKVRKRTQAWRKYVLSHFVFTPTNVFSLSGEGVRASAYHFPCD